MEMSKERMQADVDSHFHRLRAPFPACCWRELHFPRTQTARILAEKRYVFERAG